MVWIIIRTRRHSGGDQGGVPEPDHDLNPAVTESVRDRVQAVGENRSKSGKLKRRIDLGNLLRSWQKDTERQKKTGVEKTVC